jgi:hypothetical protein
VQQAQALAQALPATAGGSGEDVTETSPAPPQRAQGDAQIAPKPGIWDRIMRLLGGA